MPDQFTLLGREAGEFVVNTVTDGSQYTGRVARLANGGFVVTWTDSSGSDGSLTGVKAQVYNAAGQKVGGELQVNTTTAGHQDAASVTGLAGGGFAVSFRSGWESTQNFGTGKLQLFDAAGNKVGGELDHGLSTRGLVPIAALPSGGFVLTTRGGAGQMFDANGSPAGAQFTVPTTPNSVNASAVAAALPDGRFVVAFERAEGIWFQIFSATGEKTGPEVYSGHFNSGVTGTVGVTVLTNGNFVLQWSRVPADQQDPEWSIRAQIFNASGAPVGGLIYVNATTEGYQQVSRGIALPDGSFMLGWTSFAPGTGQLPSVVKGQLFNAQGQHVGGEFDISVETDHPRTNHANIDFALVGSDRIVAVWTGSGPGDPRPDPENLSGGGIRAQIFRPVSMSEVDASVSDTTISEIAVGGVPMAALSATSPAVNGDFTFSYISDTAGGAFTVKDGKLVVSDNRKLDFETAPTVSVTVRVTDSAGHSVDEVIQINIADSAVEKRYTGGEEVSSSTTQGSYRLEPAMAKLSTGGFVLIWSEGAGLNVHGRRFDSAGNPVGAEFLVNTAPDSLQHRPAVTGLAGGGFAVSWTDFGSGYLKLQLFNVGGAKVGGEVLVTGAVNRSNDGSTVTALAGGGLVVTWTDGSQTGAGDTSGSAVRAQLFDAAGNKVGGEILVNTTVAQFQYGSSAAALPGGGFIVAWTDSGPDGAAGADGSGTATMAQRFDAAGNKVGGEFVVNTATAADQSDPSVAVAADGTYLIVWGHYDEAAEVAEIRGQRFAANGDRAGGEFVIGTGLGGIPHVTAGANGMYVVTWSALTELDSHSSGVLGQFVSAAGLLVGDPFLVNQVASGSQYDSTAVLLDDGTLATAWRTDGPTGGQDVKLRIFADSNRPTARADQFLTDEATAVTGSLFADNGSGADSGEDRRIVAVNGSSANVGQSILLASGARATVNSDGTFSIDPTGASWLVAPGSGAVSHVVETFSYILAGGSGATVTVRVNGLTSANDEYRGTTGSDSITGSEGADFFRINQPNAAFVVGDTVHARGGDDIIYIGSKNEAYVIDGGAGTDTIVMRNGGHRFLEGQLTGIERVVIRSGTATVYGDAPTGTRAGNIELQSGNASRTINVDASELTAAEPLILTLKGAASYAVTSGAGNDMIAGSVSSDVIAGGAGDDQLSGGDAFHGGNDGADVLRGGTGNDTYGLYDADIAEENAGEGTDSVEFYGSVHAMGANIENLVVRSAQATITGNALNNRITGNYGKDVIDGGAGADRMDGGAGHDIYYVDDAGDEVIESFWSYMASEWNEIRTTLTSYSLASVTGVGDLTGLLSTGQTLTGSSGRNVITGGAGNDIIDGAAADDILHGGLGNDVIGGGADNDTLHGGAGDDALDGGTGADRMEGGAGNDVYHVDNAGDVVEENGGAGSDEVRTSLAFHTLGANVEKLTGTSAGDQTLTGNALDNVIAGGAGNDQIDGGAGADTMNGGAGHDLYTVDNAADVVIDSGGIDEIITALSSYSLAGAPGIENLRGAGTGQALTGNALANRLSGTEGNDILDGREGADVMVGSAGNDIFYVDDAGDQIVDPSGAGTDEIRTSLASYSLAALNSMSAVIENLTGTSNAGQTLTGSSIANAITGAGGNDVITGGGGADALRGGAGADRFVYAAFSDSPGNARDRILDFEVGIDKIDLTALGTVQALFSHETVDGQPVTILTIVKGNASMTIQVSGTISESDLLGEFGISGTAGDDVIEGTNDADSIRGLDGNDRLYGLGGDDILDGGAGDDLLDGGPGADLMRGGVGDDAYIVDGSDTVVEQAGEGVDEVRTALANYTLGANVERLTGTSDAGQTLSGNGLANVIRAGGGADTLHGGDGNDQLFGGAGNDAFNAGGGSDLIDGGTGADIMGGFVGDDIFIVDDAGDRTIEASGEGTDETRTALASYALEANVENLTGTSASGQTLTGNELNNLIIGGMGDDVIHGGAGDDVIIGFAGADVLRGGAGNDVYAIDAADIIIEFAGDGYDEVRTVAEIFVLADTLENLRATSDIGHDFRGNAGNNVIIGGNGNDMIRMADGGDDMAFGKDGIDSFYFGAAFGANDKVDGGGNRDSLLLQGDYSAGITFLWAVAGGSSLVDVEGISLVSGSNAFFGDTANNRYSYNLTLVDSNVAAGALMKVNGFNLLAGENITIDASAESDAALQILAGLGTDTLKGGGQGDAFVFGHNGRFGAGDTINGGGGYDVVYLRGDYAIDFNAAGFAGAFTGVESIALLTSANTEFLAGGDGEFDYNIVWNDAMLAAGGTFTVNGSRLGAAETFVFDGSAETNGTLRVFGGAAADSLTGGGGNDQITGGGGADTLVGGAGADLFRFAATSDSTSGAFDTVQDFVAGTDKIDVQRVDAKASTATDNEAFAFIGAAAFSASGANAPGELRAFNVSGNLWQVEGDVNGDGVADLVIQVHVEAGQPLTAGDFLV